METILLNFLIFIILGAVALFILNGFYSIKLKSEKLRPMVKVAIQYALEHSFDFFAEKICIKPDNFIRAFNEKFYEQAKSRLPRATIEKIEILHIHDQNISITVKTPGLFFQDVEYEFATLMGSKTVWGMVTELGLLDFYLRQKAAALKKKLEQEREIFVNIEEDVAKVIKKLPLCHVHGVRQYNWDEILTTLYNRGENDLYKLIKENYSLLTSFHQSVS